MGRFISALTSGLPQGGFSETPKFAECAGSAFSFEVTEMPDHSMSPLDSVIDGRTARLGARARWGRRPPAHLLYTSGVYYVYEHD
jgi:hypothetical protein